jgi:rubrerythrin
VKTAFLEACVGESIAALEVAEAAAHATDPAVARALSAIADDEMRHASLGFRFVRWALGALPQEKRAALAAELRRLVEERSTSEQTAVESACEDRALAAHGLLPESVLRAARAKALAEIVGPCTRAALAVATS